MFVDHVAIMFNRFLERIETEIPYNSDWETGSPGHIPGSVNGPIAPAIKPGEYAKAKKANGEQIMFIGTTLGNVVVHRKYPAGYTWEYSDKISQSRILFGRDYRLTDKDLGFVYNLQKVLMSVEREMLTAGSTE